MSSIRKTGITASALLLTGSLVGWTASGLGTTSANSAGPTVAAATAAPVTTAPSATTYAGVVDHVAPAVVTIRSERRVRNVSQDLPDDPRLREFFGQFGQRGPRARPEQRQRGLGSGVAVTDEGAVATDRRRSGDGDVAADADRPGVADDRLPGGAARDVSAGHAGSGMVDARTR